MTNNKRRAIAYIACRYISNIDSGAIYDYSSSSYYNFSGAVAENVNVYDYSASNYLIGNISSIYDYGTGSYISLTITSSTFSGYDYETSYYFNGTVTGNNITIFDYQSSRYYNYSL